MFDRLRALRQVMHDASLSSVALDTIVRQRLKAVLVSAYLHVPYYRESMRSAGYNPVRDFRGSTDLACLPITTKKILKENGITEFIRHGTDLSKCFQDTTSGSTGVPLSLYRDAYERSVQIAKWLRVLFVNGYSVRDRVMSLSGPTRLTEGRSLLQHFGLLRRSPIDYTLTPDKLVDALLEYKPDVIYGGRSFLELMCMELERRPARVNPVKLVIATNEMIREGSRELCRRHFGVDLTESYGSVEMGVMAHETPDHNGLHLCEDLTFFEFLNDQDKPVSSGQRGRVVVTDLTGKLMPFIRYDQGDWVLFKEEEQADGRKRRRITRIVGRDDDYVLLPDGRRGTFDCFAEVIDVYQGIKQFRIIQKSKSLFQVLIVAERGYIATIREDLIRSLEAAFLPGVQYEVTPVDRIGADPNGKTRLFICETQ
jgi:phenylacetate-CoA ligase